METSRLNLNNFKKQWLLPGRELSLVKVTQILYLKIFIQYLCNFHADVANFSDYEALLGKSAFYQI